MRIMTKAVKKTGRKSNLPPGPGPGRPKGKPNKLTATVKEAIEEAFRRSGGVDYLVKVAAEDPKTFCTLLGKIIPTQLVGDPDNPIVAEVRRIELVPAGDNPKA